MAILDTFGSTEPIQRSTSKVSTFFDGENQSIIFRGRKAEIEALYESYKIAQGFNPVYDRVSFDIDHGVATLTLVLLTDGSPVYELTPNELSNPIESAPEFASLNDDQLIAVVKAVQNLDNADGAWSSLQTNLYSHMIHGFTEYPVSQYVLRETKNVSKRSTVQASYENVNKVDDPPNVSDVNTLLGSIPDQEWLKKSPVVRQLGSQRWQIITEWWGATAWSKLLYGGSLEYT